MPPSSIAARSLRLPAFAACAILTSLYLLAPRAALAQFSNFSVEFDDAWTNLFDRTSGWTGADGIYSIPLDSNENFRNSPTRKTVFVFSDTFIGEVDSNGHRLSGTVLVNNTMALLTGSDPDPARIRFFWGRDSRNRPDALFQPSTANSQPGDWYWLGDGITLENKLHLVAYRMRRTGQGGAWDFQTAGVALISLPLDSSNPYRDTVQVDAPLFVDHPSGGRGALIMGASIMPNTLAAGAPFPDGLIYIYGTQNDPFIKKLIVARVPPNQFSDFSAWRYWDGAAWQSDIDRVAELTGRVSSECSVSPLPDGRFLLTYQEDTLGPYVTVKIADTPVGPFSDAQHIWFCDEVNSIPDAFVYNAKAHPHLSSPGSLLISYNVNNQDFAYHFQNADAYRPRFIRIRYTGQ